MQRSLTISLVFAALAALFFLILGILLAPKAFAGQPADGSAVFNSLNLWNNSDDDWDDDWDSDMDDNRSDPVIRYNRVEGLFIGLDLDRDYKKLEYPDQAFMFGSVGYSFGAKEIEYMAGLEKGVFNDFRTSFGGEYHRQILTPDLWRMSYNENSLAAVLLREDFHDYYMAEGGSAYYEQYMTQGIRLQVGYHYDQLDSVDKNTNWSVFGGKKKFRPNPAMSVGNIKSVRASLMIDSRNSKKHPSRGWLIQIDGEHALSDGSDYDFDRVVTDIRRYQPMGYGEYLDLRIRAGSGSGELPWHRSFHLGGISTLRGFGYKAFPNGPMSIGGNRMLLGQVEFRMGAGSVSEMMDLDIFELNRLVLFADAGWVGSAGPGEDLIEGFGNLDWNDFKSDVGIAVTNSNGDFRVEVARRTDTSEKPFTFLIRLNRSF